MQLQLRKKKRDLLGDVGTPLQPQQRSSNLAAPMRARMTTEVGGSKRDIPVKFSRAQLNQNQRPKMWYMNEITSVNLKCRRRWPTATSCLVTTCLIRAGRNQIETTHGESAEHAGGYVQSLLIPAN